MNNVSKLKPGKYMKSTAVLHMLYHIYCRPTLGNIVEKTCKVHIGEFGEYYSTDELRLVIIPDLFKELECEIVTHIILSEEEKNTPAI